MIIRHSLLILEQLTEIEKIIQEVEMMMDKNGIDMDREKLLLKLLKNREAHTSSRTKKKN
jgi:ketopantoate reductase